MDRFAPIAAQRQALATVLPPHPGAVASSGACCDAWTVHELAGHIVVPFEVPMHRVVLEMAKAGGQLRQGQRRARPSKAARPRPDELVAAVRANAESHFTPPGHDWHAPLTDTYVHTQDICVPLGVEAPADPAQWPVILDFLMSKKARGAFVDRPLPEVRFVATDVRWSAGEGPEAERPGGRARSRRSSAAPPSPTSSRAPARRRSTTWAAGS